MTKAHIPTTCPTTLRPLAAWLCWRFEPNGNKKPRKVPVYIDGGRRYHGHGTDADRKRLVTFDRAVTAARTHGWDGVGFCPLPELGICALDFDNCVTDGRLHPEVAGVISSSYAEISPSGKGVRAFFQGDLGGNWKDISEDAPYGVEVFSNKGFVTLTGNLLPLCEIAGNDDTVALVDQPLIEFVQRRFRRSATEPSCVGYSTEPIGLTPAQVSSALAVLPAELAYDRWLMVGMALHHETSGQGFELWDEWSSYSPKYSSREYGLERWNSFGKNDGITVTARSLVHLANEHGADINLRAHASMEDFDVIKNAREELDNVEVDIRRSDGDKGLPPPKLDTGIRFRPVAISEFAQRPAPRWVVKGVIPRAELVVVFGESGSGKSFMALDLAACIAQGLPWRGHRVRQGRVVYIAAEGAGGFRNRCVAYAQSHDLQLAGLAIDVIDAAPNLLLKDDALDVARGIGQADVVIVDTWAQVTPGGNENAGEDMGKALAHCKGIHRATGATVVLIHHSGKDTSKGARGWSGLRAAADAELEVVRIGTGRLLRTSKQKDGDDGLEWGFGLDVVEIGRDEDGDPITSCVVVEQEVPQARLVRVLGTVEKIVNGIIQEIASSQTAGIEVSAVIEESVKRMPEPEAGKRDTRKTRAKRALEGLCVGDDSLYFIADDGTLEVV